jgi:hypothetical protein
MFRSTTTVPVTRVDAASPPLVVQRETRNYSRLMPDKLNALLDRLKAHQSDLILAMAEHDGMPAGSALRQVAELENVIAAVEAVADEEASRERKSG